MIPTYMPFTYLPASMARVLAALVGPVVVYQPLGAGASNSLASLAAQGVIEIRTPLTGDEQRLTAALAEFTQWASQNPGRSTPGPGFVGSQQGRVPFYDEQSISRIRSDIRQYGTPPSGTDDQEAGFSARLFLAVAEENDRATEHLDHDLKRFKALEQGFLDSLVDSDVESFSRHTLGSGIWREDPGAKHTEQRIRAWATLAAADNQFPEMLVTTSAAVVDTLMETRGEAINLQRLATIQFPISSAGQTSILGQVLADLAVQQSLATGDCDAFTALNHAGGGDSTVAITLYAARNCPPSSVIRQMAPAAVTMPEKTSSPAMARHTLIVLVDVEPKSD
jgi:hypothetical protein